MTLCLGLGNLQKLSSTNSLKLVESAIELGIRRFDSSVNYSNNSDVLDIFFREPSNSKVILKVGNSTQFELRSLRADLKSVQRVDRSNIETIMLHSIPITQIYGKTLDYLQDYCKDLEVPLGISCDNSDLKVASRQSVFQYFMCTNSLIDYANVPIIKESKLDYSRFYFKRVLANAPWRIMLPQYEYRRIVRMKDYNK